MINLVDVIELSKQLCKHPIQGKLAYATTENVAAQVIDGYHAEVTDLCLLTPKPAQALCEAQNLLNQEHAYSLFIYDAYRPKRAVKHFLRWAAAPCASELERSKKALHYPAIDKSELFEKRYFSEDSGHCYGNTVDVVLVDLNTGKFLNMGSRYDFMGEESHLSASAEIIGAEVFNNRKLLIETMERCGFHSYHKEYWHYSHGGTEGREVTEAFDVEITNELRGIGVRR